MRLAMRFIPDFENYSRDSFAIFGFIMIIIILAIVAFIGYDNKKTHGARKTVALKRITCPLCRGATKIPEQTHDSDDIQFATCGRCGGAGTILMI